MLCFYSLGVDLLNKLLVEHHLGGPGVGGDRSGSGKDDNSAEHFAEG